MNSSEKVYDILVVGGGGREHAIINKLKESKKCGELYCTPGNGGISKVAKCFDVKSTDNAGVIKLAKKLGVDIVIVAPDDPLVGGMIDALDSEGFITFGPRENAAIIEGSKVFSKKLMKDYNIPTARYEVFDKSSDALKYIRQQNVYPAVVKADGLAFGKGVVLCDDYYEAKEAVKSIMDDGIFGASGKRIVVEEFLTGGEVSVLAFTDGKTVTPMVSAMDHKRAFDGDMGPNTGGMGTLSPNPHYTEELKQLCMETIFVPTIKAMEQERRVFKGCLFFGLMITNDGPKVIEYNCRFGDPETQVVLPRLKTDFVDIIVAIWENRLGEMTIEWLEDACACVVMASGGYPSDYAVGLPIKGLNSDGERSDAMIFHAGTKWNGKEFVTNGGRVIGVTCLADSVEESLDKAYEAVSRISFKDAHFRKDIGRTV